MPHDAESAKDADGVAASAAKPEVSDNLVVTHHRTTVAGRELAYTVTCGTLVFKQESEKRGDRAGEAEGAVAKAEIFFIAYTLDDVDDPAERPLTFSFNGGPGSSSIWMHLGLLGPKRVLLDDEGFPLPPPYELVDNDHSLLDVSDLVFIDPVSTGFSRPVVGEKAKQFHSLKTDVASVGDFIRLYVSRYARWNSPKFLIGESYGTTRAAALSGYLQGTHGLYLSGLMLISVVLDFQTLRFATGNDLPAILYLPTYAATAHYHGKLPDDLQAKPLRDLLDEVEAFAIDRYAPALMKGVALPADERSALVRDSEDYVDRTDLRIEILRFCKELLRDRRKTVGRIDSRYTGTDRDSAGAMFEYDPSLAATNGPYSATFNDYVRRKLGYESDLPYRVLAPLYQEWTWDADNRFIDVAETLRQAMSINPALKVHLASGYYDLATPHFATEYTFNRLPLAPELRANISTSYYEAGHMMYVQIASLAKMKGELEAFIDGALG
jgi:carboxypeptidase C (cathepsin A)